MMTAVLTFTTICISVQNSALGPGDYARPLDVNRRTRTYLVHVPPAYDGNRPFAVVLIFRGGGSNGETMVRFSGLNEKADTAGFVAVYPNGTGRLVRWEPKRAARNAPVPVIHFHGTADDFAPFDGGKGKGVSGTDFFSVEHSVWTWVAANRCPKEPRVEQLPDKANDGTTVTRKTYGPGTNGTEVVLVVIHGGGHTWPGHQPLLGFLGKSTKNVSANDLMWDFFQKHPMR
jgi:poly(3-hydroxybutyrate) depolymerase